MKPFSRCCLVLIAALVGVLLAASVAAAAAPPTQPGNVSVVAQGETLVIYHEAAGSLASTEVARVPMSQAPLVLADYVALSPNGQSVVYVTMDNPYSRANAEVHVAASDGSGSRAIARFAQGFWLTAPVWSTDGQRLAYVIERAAPQAEDHLELWIMDRDGANQTRVLQGAPLRPDLFAASAKVIGWSADGRQVTLNDQTVSPPVRFMVEPGAAQVSQEPTVKDANDSAQAAAVATALPCSVQLWHQNNYSDIMQTCNNSIANVGCALTSTAMVFKYFGVNTDPPALNRCLGSNACPIYWSTAASSCSEGKVSYVGAPGFSYGTIDSDLGAGRPIIVYLTRSSNTHFVVVTGGGGQTPSGYSINDPARYATLRTTLAPYTNEGWTPSGLRRYSGTPNCGDSDGGDISYGQSRNGAINPAYDYDDYYFNGASGEVAEISQFQNGGSLDSFLRLYDPAGNLIASNDDYNNTVHAFIRQTLNSSGRYRIRAMAYSSSTGPYTIRVQRVSSCVQDCRGENRWIAFGQTLYETVDPANDRDTYYFSGTAGRIVDIRMNRTGGSLDSYLELWSPNNVKVAENDDGGGDGNSRLVYTLPTSGNYRISAYSYSNASRGAYEIRLQTVTSRNLALNKPVWVSSVEGGGLEGWRATDGNMGTRWSSQFRDPQQINIDLGSTQTFNQVVLKWEAAYGRTFGIYYLDDGSQQWRNVSYTTSGSGATTTLNFSPVRARILCMFGTQRGTPWGYSLWEFEVYDTNSVTMPLVPPGDPAKVNTAEEVAPLPPALGDKDAILSGDGESGQEVMPAPASDAPPLTGEVEPSETVFVTIRTPDTDGLWRLYTAPDQVRFTGEASSHVEGEAVPIVGYRWRSDRQGMLGTQAEFTLPASALLPGVHTIYFQAQNELGTWSSEVSVVLDVEQLNKTLLPLLMR